MELIGEVYIKFGLDKRVDFIHAIVCSYVIKNNYSGLISSHFLMKKCCTDGLTELCKFSCQIYRSTSYCSMASQ